MGCRRSGRKKTTVNATVVYQQTEFRGAGFQSPPLAESRKSQAQQDFPKIFLFREQICHPIRQTLSIAYRIALR